MAQTMTADDHAADKKPIDKFIPWMFVLFFLVVGAVNAVFVYYALSTQPGVVTEHNYKFGLAYDDVLKRARDQSALGFTDEKGFENGVLYWSILKADQTPLIAPDLKVMARVIRPSQEQDDFDVALRWNAQKHRYEAPVALQYKGRWQAAYEAKWLDPTTSEQKRYSGLLDFETK